MEDLRKISISNQNRLQRELEIKLQEAISAAVDAGLDPLNAWCAVKSVYDFETKLERGRKEDARSYL